MTRTVDLVIAGRGGDAVAAAIGALRRGLTVLLVLSGDDGATTRCVRRCLGDAPSAHAGRVTVMTGAEVVCVDGVNAVEAVVIRHTRTGRLSAVNASAFLSCHNLSDGERPRGST